MPLRYHHGGSSFRIPAAPGKKTEASKKIGQSRRLARINTGISAARNPHIKYLHTDQVVSFFLYPPEAFTISICTKSVFYTDSPFNKISYQPFETEKDPAALRRGIRKNDISFTIYYLMLTTLYPASLTILLICSSSSSRS